MIGIILTIVLIPVALNICIWALCAAMAVLTVVLKVLNNLIGG